MNEIVGFTFLEIKMAYLEALEVTQSINKR